MILSLTEVIYFARSTGVKGTSTEDTNIEGTGSESIYIKRVYTRTICSSSAWIGAASIWGINTGDACIGNASAIEHLGTDLQSFQISKVKLFGIRLEIGVGAC